jgi:uncharacterized delta-60 repeat protein
VRRALPIAAVLLLVAATPAVARPGDLDRGFARGGAALDFGADSTEGDAIALDQFGRPVIGGAEAAGRLLVMRLTTSGRRDDRFGRHGLTTVVLPGLAPGGVRGLDVFRDGRIVVAATLESPDGSAPPRVVVARLLPDGDLDPGFGDNGIAVVGPPGGRASALSLTHDGVIVVGGALDVGGADVPLVLRLAPDGTPDSTFDGDGVWSGEATPLRGAARAVLAFSDGSVAFAVGAPPGGIAPSVIAAARLTAAGALDPAFGAGDGISDLMLGPSPARDGGATGIVPGPRGRLVLAGTVTGAGGRALGVVVRMLPDGALDPRFGRAGVARLSAAHGLRVAALARARDGRLVVGGRSSSPKAAVVRLRANGRRDRTFGRRGSVVRAIGQPPVGRRTYSEVSALAVQRGGGVLTAGSVADDNTLPGQRIGRRFLVVARLRG